MFANRTLADPAKSLPSYLPQKGQILLTIAHATALPSDTVLVSALGDGDQHAMGLLYDRYSPIVYSVALRVLGDAAAAEDVLQEVFLQI